MISRIQLIRPDVVLFDWDNTLVDSWPTIHDAFNATLDFMGKPLWSMAETRFNVGKSMRDTFPGLFGEHWEKARDVYLDHFHQIHMDRLAVLDGAQAMLESLNEVGVGLCVVSNKNGTDLRREAHALGWGELIEALVGANDAPQDKPAIDPALMALEKAGYAADSKAWFVGDAVVDMACANALGATAILVRDSDPDPVEFQGVSYDARVSGCPDILTLYRQSVLHPS